MSNKIANILSLIEIAENNLKNAQTLLKQIAQEKGFKTTTEMKTTTRPISSNEANALEVVEGYFDGENMIGDNGQMYPVPQNYASKSQLIIGDRMKWMLTTEREIFKLIQPAPRERVTGTFSIEGDNYVVLVDAYPNPIKILKASATYAMKNLGLEVGDEVVIIVPQGITPAWGAFSSVTKSQGAEDFSRLENLKNSNTLAQSQNNSANNLQNPSQESYQDLDDLNEFTQSNPSNPTEDFSQQSSPKIAVDNDYF